MKKRIIALVTSFALVFTTVFGGLGMPAYAAESTENELPEVKKIDYSFYRDKETGHIGMESNDEIFESEPA
ncbi:MAG: hypothetical protein U0K95_00810 [Eubacterium sp.]|nr:hypothetical protein [Eubacterium sp.]